MEQLRLGAYIGAGCVTPIPGSHVRLGLSSCFHALTLFTQPHAQLASHSVGGSKLSAWISISSVCVALGKMERTVWSQPETNAAAVKTPFLGQGYPYLMTPQSHWECEDLLPN